MKELSTDEILKICNKLGFKINGIYCRDEIFTIRNGCYVINMDSKKNMIGTHWTGIFKNNNTIYYFDSFGMMPPDEITRKLIKSSINVYYNDLVYQNIISNSCGYFVILFLFYMKNKISYYNFLYNVLKPFNINYNEKLLKKIFNKIYVQNYD